MEKIRNSLQEDIIEEQKSSNRLYIAFIVFASIILIVSLLFNYIFFHVVVVGSSMYPTLKNGDALIVNRITEPTRGDIVIIDGEASGGKLLIKRVIGVGGDTITIKEGYVFRNGEKLKESNYLTVDGLTFYPIVNDQTNTGEHTWIVDDGEYFYLGDNRRNSSDSRNDFYGTCSRSQIIGVVSERAVKMKETTKVINNIANYIKGLFGIDTMKGE